MGRGSGQDQSSVALRSSDLADAYHEDDQSWEPLDALYHVAPRSAREEIFSKGLQTSVPRHKAGQPQAVYLWSNLDSARYWQNLSPSETHDIWEVKEGYVEEVFHDEHGSNITNGAVACFDDIPAAVLSIV